MRPREIDPRIELDTYTALELPGVRQLEAFWKSALDNGATRPNPFEASTFEGVLKAAVGHLDPTGAYVVLTDDPTPPVPGDKLKITNTWVLFARRRSSGIFLEDIARLKKSVEAATVLPAVVRDFVERGIDEIVEPVLQAFRGLSSSDGHSEASELYFPIAYNDEQVSIVQKLQFGNGVVVQGPPGTGKTHTIANIISHYLAQGLRVLVTSKGESALNEVIGKLPERILAAVAKQERVRLSERTVAGLERARAQGRVGGRPRIVCDRMRVQALRKAGMSLGQIAVDLRLSKTTVSRIVSASI